MSNSQEYTSTGQYTATEQSTTSDPSQYTTDAAYTSYGEVSASERSPYEKTDDDSYSYSEEGEGESTYYEGEGEGSYSDDGFSEYSEGQPSKRSWLEQQGLQMAAVGTLLKMQLDRSDSTSFRHRALRHG